MNITLESFGAGLFMDAVPLQYKLQGKTILLTGGGEIGNDQLACKLGEFGANIVIAGKILSKCLDTAHRIDRLGKRALALDCNAQNKTDLRRCVDHTLQHYGQIDIVINYNYEISSSPLLHLRDQAILSNWQVGPLATLRMMKIAHPFLKESRGHIINLLCHSATHDTLSSNCALRMIRATLKELTNSAAKEWENDNIRVNSIVAQHLNSKTLTSFDDDKCTHIATTILDICTQYHGLTNGHLVDI